MAEVTDVAVTVIDGADGIMLNDETSIGDFPGLAVLTLQKLCREAEAEVWIHEVFSSLNLAVSQTLYFYQYKHCRVLQNIRPNISIIF